MFLYTVQTAEIWTNRDRVRGGDAVQRDGTAESGVFLKTENLLSAVTIFMNQNIFLLDNFYNLNVVPVYK